MMPAPIEPATFRRIIASARLLSSDKDGEAFAALSAVRKMLPDGVDIADALERGLTAAEPESIAAKPDPFEPVWTHRAAAEWALQEMDGLSEWETNFLLSIIHYRRLSPKQHQTLCKIVERGGFTGRVL